MIIFQTFEKKKQMFRRSGYLFVRELFCLHLYFLIFICFLYKRIELQKSKKVRKKIASLFSLMWQRFEYKQGDQRWLKQGYRLNGNLR